MKTILISLVVVPIVLTTLPFSDFLIYRVSLTSCWTSNPNKSFVVSKYPLLCYQTTPSICYVIYSHSLQERVFVQNNFINWRKTIICQCANSIIHCGNALKQWMRLWNILRYSRKKNYKKTIRIQLDKCRVLLSS